MNWIFVFLSLLAASPRLSVSDKESFLEKVCYNALATRDPYCLNGGTLHATNKSDYLNCASCDCPDGWRGVNCGLCSSTNMCPRKKGKTAVSCTSTSISPTNHELIAGKHLSCYCGGDDSTTKYICKMQPGTNWQITIPAPNDEGFFNMSVIERAGIPSQDYRPSCVGHDPNRCPTKERYRYTASQIFEGKFLNCYWEKGDCVSPLKGKDCVVYKCKDVDLECPPSYVKKCLGWTPFRCGYPPGEDRRYWMHHCNPLAMPMSGLDTKLACRASSENGKFQCYMTQEESIFASIGMQCETGSCVYENQAEETTYVN